jgi:hypothetical protein
MVHLEGLGAVLAKRRAPRVDERSAGPAPGGGGASAGA